MHRHWYRRGVVWNCEWDNFIQKQHSYGPWFMSKMHCCSISLEWIDKFHKILHMHWYIQATPAMSTSRISILSLMSKWFFIPNIFSIYIFAFQLRQSRKRLTWSNGYLEVIFHALDVFSIIFATSYVEVKNRCTHGCHIVCFGYVHVSPEVRKSSKQKSETIKVI